MKNIDLVGLCKSTTAQLKAQAYHQEVAEVKVHTNQRQQPHSTLTDGQQSNGTLTCRQQSQCANQRKRRQSYRWG